MVTIFETRSALNAVAISIFLAIVDEHCNVILPLLQIHVILVFLLLD